MRSGDALEIEDVDVTVIDVNPTSTTIRANAREFSIPLITSSERKFVLALWETRRQKAEALQTRALALAEEERLPPIDTAPLAAGTTEAVPGPTLNQVDVDSTPAYNYGYAGYYPTRFERYYPTRFEVVPYTCRWPSGQVFSQRILVPSSFERHHGGDGHWRH